jgi:AmmeMemoRadiSam system protein A
MSGLSNPEQDHLLGLARASVTATVLKRELPAPDWPNLPQRLSSPGASFVTLTIGDRLRGCIGTLQAVFPLADDVILRASAAAKDDPRFPPVSESELALLSLEVSVLSEPRPMTFTDPTDLLARLRPGIDGVILVYGRQRATFLPQVWERVPEPIQFLEMLCRKAALPADAWRTHPIQVSTYQVESFHQDPNPSAAG